MNRAYQVEQVVELAGARPHAGDLGNATGADATEQLAPDLNRAAVERLGFLIPERGPEATAHVPQSERLGQVSADLRVAGRVGQQLFQQLDGSTVIGQGLG